MTQPTTNLVDIDRLRPAPWNPRAIRDSRFQNLCASLRADPDFLWSRPILALKDGTIFGGNQRYQAAVEIGMTKVPAILHDIPERLAKERAIRDNAHWGEWETESVRALLRELQQLGADVDVMGFDGAELGQLLAEMQVSLPPPPTMPTQASIDAEKVVLEERFSGRAARDFVDVTCPGCHSLLSVLRSEWEGEPASSQT